MLLKLLQILFIATPQNLQWDTSLMIYYGLTKSWSFFKNNLISFWCMGTPVFCHFYKGEQLLRLSVCFPG